MKKRDSIKNSKLPVSKAMFLLPIITFTLEWIMVQIKKMNLRTIENFLDSSSPTKQLNDLNKLFNLFSK